jgi:peptide/nickel transport system permease protein
MTRFRRGATFWLGVILLGTVSVLALLSIIWTPHNGFLMSEEHRLAVPSLRYWLGTDLLGRDLLSRMMIASRMALGLAVGSGFGAMAIGLFLALLMLSNRVLYRFFKMLIDMIMIFPTIVLVLVMITLLGSGFNTTLLALGVVNIPRFTKVALAAIREQAGEEYLLLARSLGQPRWQIAYRHYLPILRLPMTQTITVTMASIILSEASLSFLGLGIMPPQPSWGYTLSEAKSYLFSYPHLAFAPLLFIFATILSLNLISYAFSKD